jgi:oligopeptide/dipeptide ABC transporter ATP-binding protein
VALLTVKNLETWVGPHKALEGISFSIEKGETLALVGESGSGKSLTALSIMGLLESNSRAQGEVLFREENLLTLPQSRLEQFRGRSLSMIFQEPMTSLNPVFSVGEQIREVYRVHCPAMGRMESKEKTLHMLELVQIPDPKKRYGSFPHELSGGMRQRVMIAMALALEPDLLIADEPTTALDVTVQAQILDLMEDLQKKIGMGILLITHDLAVVSQIAPRVMVMYAGRILEKATAEELCLNPAHPYTRALLESMPRLGREKVETLFTISGLVPSLKDRPQKGCPFAPRCHVVEDRCWDHLPPAQDFRELLCVRSPL